MVWPRRNRGYGRVLPTHRWQGLTLRQRNWNALNWWLGAGVLIAGAWYFLVDTRIGPATIPPGPNEVITAKFVRCGQHGSSACVPDGDTLIIGPRRIRIIGIDAPELHPARCPAEAAQGEAAAQALLALANQGSFTLAGPNPPVHDEYGRELRHVLRGRPDGSVQSFADDLVAGGTVRPYLRGPRLPWC